MTLSTLERWKREFRKSAKADHYVGLREHLRKLELPDTPELLLEGTIQFLQAAMVYATLDQQPFGAFLAMQTYDPADSDEAMYAFTFDICGKSFGRVLVSKKADIPDLADLYNHPWDDLELVGYNWIYISRTDGRPLGKPDMVRLERDINYDLRFEDGDGVDIDFDYQSIQGALKVGVQDRMPDE
jgi:hypothetical protein